MAGAEGLEPPTHGFGDHRSTRCATLPCIPPVMSRKEGRSRTRTGMIEVWKPLALPLSYPAMVLPGATQAGYLTRRRIIVVTVCGMRSGQRLRLYWCCHEPAASSPTLTLLSYHVRPTFSVFKYIFFCAILSKNDTKKKLSTISLMIVSLRFAAVNEYQAHLHRDGFFAEHGPGQPPQCLPGFRPAVGHAGAGITGRAFP